MIKKFNTHIKESLEESDFLKNHIILYSTLEEALHIKDILLLLGFNVYDQDDIEIGWNIWKGFIYSKDRNYFVQSGNRRIEPISYNDFINLLITKSVPNRKKIKKPEIDPFEEENWGYEKELNESSKFDFEVGERVSLIGTGDGKKLDGISGIIVVKNRKYSKIETNMDENGLTSNYYYYGTHYGIQFDEPMHLYNIDWFVSPFNIINSQTRKKIKKPEIDPFEEEDWGYQ